MSMAHTSARLTAVAVLAATLTAVSVPVLADPVYPSQDQVDQAKGAVNDQAARIAQLQNQLAQLSTDLDQKNIAAQVADQSYLQAQEALDAKTRAAQDAQAKADSARQQLASARDQVGRIAADMYRTGGGAGSVQALLDAQGPSDAFDRAESLRLLGQQRDQTFQNADAIQIVAKLLQKQADEARAQQAAATDELHRKAAQAQALADQAQAAVATTDQQRGQAIAQLATLQQTSVELEQQRQAGIAAEEERRREEQARAAALARAQQLAAQQAAQQAAAQRAAAQQAAPRSNSGTASRPSSGAARPAAPAPSAPRPASAAPVASGSAVETAIAFAESKIGTWYLWGGTGPQYDCSGLTQAAYLAAGINITRTTYSQYSGNLVPLSQMRRGDLIFYGTGSTAASTYHVAIYLGGGQMLEAPHTGAQVRIAAVRYSGIMPLVRRV